jgi:RNA polymerase sigma-70 factor (ECF subfamily)
VHPTPVVELNRAVAISMSGAVERGLAMVDGLDQGGELEGYHRLPAARAELLRRLGRHREASAAYDQALALVGNEPERRHLQKRRREVESQGGPAIRT